MRAHALPIGVFDSGVGGLTVLRALRTELPQERFLYLGDTARLPYGTKSAATVERYALQATDHLIARGIRCLVVACNTASAAALPAIRARHPELPVVGVVEPGAQAAAGATRSGRIAVIATEATVRGGAYQTAIAQRLPAARVQAAACQVFVALAEEGWIDGPAVRAAAVRYLQPLFVAMPAAERPDTLVLGCTHFPVLRSAIEAVLAELAPDWPVSIVDSAQTTARAARVLLRERALPHAGATDGAPREPAGGVRFLATDGAARFAAVGARFLGEPIAVEAIELVDL